MSSAQPKLSEASPDADVGRNPARMSRSIARSSWYPSPPITMDGAR